MSWLVEDRRHQRIEAGDPLLTEELRRRIADVYFPRYPTKRACLLPALHLVQHEYGWIPPQALQEVAEFLEIKPAEALDTATFYEEYWLRRKGKYLVQVCRSLSCEVCGSDRIIEGLIDKLGIEIGETSQDERFTLVELECLGACGDAPVALINDVLHENITLESISRLIDDLPDDPHDYHDPTVEFEVPTGNPPHGTYVQPEGVSAAGPVPTEDATSRQVARRVEKQVAEQREEKGPEGREEKSSKPRRPRGSAGGGKPAEGGKGKSRRKRPANRKKPPGGDKG